MTKNYTKGIFLGGVFVATMVWAGLALVLLVGGWWTWGPATVAWVYAGFTTAHVLRNGVRTPQRKAVMVPTMTMTSQNRSTGKRMT